VCVDGRGDGGGEEVGGAARGEEAADGSEGCGCGLHDVVVGCAVDVDVEEGGREGGCGEVEDGCAGGDSALVARVEMEAMRPSSRMTMGWSWRREPS
jgi:hypothetical protein